MNAICAKSARPDELLLWSGEVQAYFPGAPEWMPSVELTAGDTYRVLADGVVTVNLSGLPRDCNGCHPETDPPQCDGIAHDNEYPGETWIAPETKARALSGKINDRFVSIGCDTLFVAEESGLLSFVFNDTRHYGEWQFWDNSGHFNVAVYDVLPTPVVQTSWGSIKSVYR